MAFTFLPKQHLLKNSQQDLSVIYLPILLFLLLSSFLNLDKSDAFLFFSFFIIDAGRLYSTFLEMFIGKKQFKSKRTLIISSIALFLNIFCSYALKGNFFVFLFYLTIIHHIYMNVKILNLYSSFQNYTTKLLFILSLIFPMLFSHFRGIKFGNDLTYSLRPLALDLIIPETYFPNILFGGTIFCIIFLLGFYLYLIYKKENAAFYYIYFSLLYLCCFILIKDIVLAMSIYVLIHGIPFFFFYQKRLSFTHSSNCIKKYSYAFVALLFIVGGILEANIEDGSSFFPPHLNNIIFAMAFFPVTAHYIFNFFTWSDNDQGYQFLKNFVNR